LAESKSNGLADPAAAPCDDCDFIPEPWHHIHHFSANVPVATSVNHLGKFMTDSEPGEFCDLWSLARFATKASIA
jgi:hypothetical protein